MRFLRLRIGGALLAVTLALAPGTARAFDTGHHSDLTREVLAAEGFRDPGIQAAQLTNWLVDYYSSRVPEASQKADVDTLHFDNLWPAANVSNHWLWLRVNTKNAVEQAAKTGDVVKLITITGMTLHAVQDFYSHSNWVELHPRTPNGPYRTETYTGGPLPSGMNLWTARASYYKGPAPPSYVQNHGGYDSGQNHDCYGRPRWDEAYVFAFAGSREWVAAIRTWANAAKPGFWDAAKAYMPTGGDAAELARDHHAAYRISEWAKNPSGSEDGHWKGKGSGVLKEFLPFAAKWMATDDSIWTNQYKGSNSTLKLVSTGLTGASPPSVTPPPVPSLPTDYRAVIVRTLSVKEKDDVGLLETRIDPGEDADFFAKVTVGGQTFIEAMQLDKASVAPAWMTIKFVPASLTGVPIKYELWDEDLSNDDQADINPASGKRDLNFILNLGNRACTGDVSGVFDGPTRAFTAEGKKSDNNRAVVVFYVAVADLAKK